VPPATVSPAQIRLAITEKFNVSLVNGFGGAKRIVTSRGSGYTGVWYSKYSWSADGKYLLLVRNTVTQGHGTRVDLLLLDPTGVVLRTLASLPESTDFDPAWANDTDQIAYVAWQKQHANNRPYNAVNAVDVTGHKRFLWGYFSTGEGCGGGTADPAAYTYWGETGFGGVPQSLQWSVSRHIAIYSASCAGGLQLADLRTGNSHALGQSARLPWNEAALSHAGILAATVTRCARQCTTSITLVNTASGALIRNIGPGELPSWSPDNRTLYFTRRAPGRTLHMIDGSGNRVGFQTFVSSIWRANADGTHVLRLLSENAFAFGPLNVTPDGRSLIYSRVDNDLNLYNHRLPGDRFTDQMVKLYGPTVNVERFDSGQRPVVIAPNAGRPAVQP
jgi:hypothetical protein